MFGFGKKKKDQEIFLNLTMTFLKQYVSIKYLGVTQLAREFGMSELDAKCYEAAFLFGVYNYIASSLEDRGHPIAPEFAVESAIASIRGFLYVSTIDPEVEKKASEDQVNAALHIGAQMSPSVRKVQSLGHDAARIWLEVIAEKDKDNVSETALPNAFLQHFDNHEAIKDFKDFLFSFRPET